MAEFALNNAVHASTGLTPFFINNARHPRAPALLAVENHFDGGVSSLGVGGTPARSESSYEEREERQAESGVASKSAGQPALPPALACDGLQSDGQAASVISANTTSLQVNGVQTRAAAKAATSATLPDGVSASSMTRWASRALIDPQKRPTVVSPREHDTATSVVSHGATHAIEFQSSVPSSEAISELLLHRQSVVRFVRDAIASAVDKQKENADKRGRKNKQVFAFGE